MKKIGENRYICPSCGSEYEYQQINNTWVRVTLTRSMSLLMKSQIHDLKVIEGIIKKY
jgi:hypothetical protein